MSKSKHKAQQQNFLQYFLNEFILFRRDFSFVTHLSPEQTAETLQELTENLSGERIIAEVASASNNISFEVKVEQREKRSYKQSAKATGAIFADDDGMTIIEGSVIMGSAFYWIMMALMIAFIIIELVTSNHPFMFLVVLLAAAIVISWWGMYSDRNHLVKSIEKAVLPEKTKNIV